MPLPCPKTTSTVAVTRSGFLLMQGDVSAPLNIIRNVLIHLGISPPTPSPAGRRRRAHRNSSLMTDYHQEATTSTAFKLSGLGISIHYPPIGHTRHSLHSLSDDPSHKPDLDLTWRTPRQTERSMASLPSYTSFSDDEGSSAANSSIARSDDGSFESDMAVDLPSPPPRHSQDRSPVQDLSLTFSGLYIASPPPTIVPLSRREGLQRTPRRSCRSDCSCHIERDTRGRPYHEDALMLFPVDDTFESPRERQWGDLQPDERQMTFPRPLWKFLEHPSPLVASNATCFTPQVARASRKYAPGKRDSWEDEGNPFLLTKYDFSPYRHLRPRFKTEREEESPVRWSPPGSPSIQMSPASTTWSLGTQFGLGIFLEQSRLADGMGLGLDFLS